MKKFIIFLGILILSVLTINIRLFASNSYYLMSCTEQNIPTGYYANVDTTSEATMRESLCNIISANYVGGSYDKAWDIDSYADADPYNEGNIQCVYTGQSIPNDKNHHGNNGWDREHIWCKSHGFKGVTKGGSERNAYNNAYNDCHHLRAAEHMTNVNRSDKDFGELESYTGSDTYGNKWTDSIFEPRDEVKGDIARMLFYMMIRYGVYSTDTFMTFIDDVDTAVAYNLELVDEDTTTTSTGNGRLGKLSTLLKWHYEDPVSDREIYRNNVVYLYQKNRNPFIDHPEYVDIAFENSYGPYEAPTSTPVEPDDTPRTETLVKTIGFEAEEGFEATSTYNTNKVDGVAPEKWAIYNGTVATTNKISGSQSLQLRWYASDKDIIPAANTLYEIDNLSHITFKAKGTSGVSIRVVYSIDDGVTWIDGDTFDLTTTAKSYTSTLAVNGGYGKARIGFIFGLPETLPTSGNLYISIDDLNIYKAKDSAGIEFAKENTKANLKLKYDETKVTNTETYFEKVTDLSELTDGSEFIIATYDINTYPYSIGTYSNNRYYGIPVNVREDRLYVDNPTTVTLESGSVENTYAIKLGTKYIGNNSAKSNNIYALDTIDVNTSWNISIDNTGLASVVLAEDSANSEKRRVMSFNTSSSSGGVTNYFFSCYLSTMKSDIAFYKKVTKEVENSVYTYNETYLRFVGLMDNEVYQDILTEDTNAVFGIALSKDDTLYTNYECVVTKANLVDGVLVDAEDGTYAYFALKLLTPKEHFADLVYAKAYVIIDGNTYYMSVSNYSVESLVNYYLNNITLTQAQIDLVGGLVK